MVLIDAHGDRTQAVSDVLLLWVIIYALRLCGLHQKKSNQIK